MRRAPSSWSACWKTTTTCRTSTRTWTSTSRSWRVSVSAGRGARTSRPARALAAARPSRTPFRILGIDPGTLRMGYGMVECQAAARVAYVECGVSTAPGRSPRPERLCEIGRGLRERMAELRPDAVAMEEAFYGKNVQATLALAEARGVALFIAAEQGLIVTGYPPATVKQAVV